MPNTRFVIRNTSSQVMNGTTGWSARHENAGFPLSNLVSRDRYTPWIYSGGSTVTNMFIDVATTSPVNFVGVLGINRFGGSTMGTMTVALMNGTASQLPLGSVGISDRIDAHFITPIEYAASFVWRIGIGNMSSPFSIGQIWLGRINNTAAGTSYGVDLGIAFTTRQTRHGRTQLVSQTIAGLPVVTDYGNDYRTFGLSINSWPASIASLGTIAQALGQASQSICYIDHADRCYECLVPSDGVQIMNRPGAGTLGLLDVNIELRQLP